MRSVRWIRVETCPRQCVPAQSIGGCCRCGHGYHGYCAFRTWKGDVRRPPGSRACTDRVLIKVTGLFVTSLQLSVRLSSEEPAPRNRSRSGAPDFPGRCTGQEPRGALSQGAHCSPTDGHGVACAVLTGCLPPRPRVRERPEPLSCSRASCASPGAPRLPPPAPPAVGWGDEHACTGFCTCVSLPQGACSASSVHCYPIMLTTTCNYL